MMYESKPKRRTEPNIPSLHLVPSTRWLHHGTSQPWLHQIPSSLWLYRVLSPLRHRLGQLSACLNHRLTAALRLSTPLAPLGSAFPPAAPWPSVTPASPQSSGTLTPSTQTPSVSRAPLPSNPSSSVVHQVLSAKSPPWLLDPQTQPCAFNLIVIWITTWLLLILASLTLPIIITTLASPAGTGSCLPSFSAPRPPSEPVPWLRLPGGGGFCHSYTLFWFHFHCVQFLFVSIYMWLCYKFIS